MGERGVWDKWSWTSVRFFPACVRSTKVRWRSRYRCPCFITGSGNAGPHLQRLEISRRPICQVWKNRQNKGTFQVQTSSRPTWQSTWSPNTRAYVLRIWWLEGTHQALHLSPRPVSISLEWDWTLSPATSLLPQGHTEPVRTTIPWSSGIVMCHMVLNSQPVGLHTTKRARVTTSRQNTTPIPSWVCKTLQFPDPVSKRKSRESRRQARVLQLCQWWIPTPQLCISPLRRWWSWRKLSPAHCEDLLQHLSSSWLVIPFIPSYPSAQFCVYIFQVKSL